LLDWGDKLCGELLMVCLLSEAARQDVE
jgi:hypothetical protein